jgi:hypothetical protein
LIEGVLVRSRLQRDAIYNNVGNRLERGRDMLKTLHREGGGQVLPIDQATLDAWGIDLHTPLKLTVMGNSLVVTPVDLGVSEAGLGASLARMRQRYREALDHLIR